MSDEERREAAPREGPYPAEKARQGRIVLNTPTRRWIFFGGLVAVLVLGLLASLIA